MVGEATTGREAVELACSTRSDVILMGIRMSDLDGMESIRLITIDEDRVGVRVLVLTTFELDENVLRARHTPSGAADLPPARECHRCVPLQGCRCPRPARRDQPRR